MATKIAMNAILARKIRDRPAPASPATMYLAMPAMSSGESSWVNASLKVKAAVTMDAAIAVEAICEKRKNP